VASLVGRVALRQVAPGGAGTQDPQDAVEDVPWVPPGPAFAVRPARRIGDQGLQDLPLLVGKVHVRPPASMTDRGTLYGPWHVYEIASRHYTRKIRNLSDTKWRMLRNNDLNPVTVYRECLA
jgi:hypothetical protein